MKRTTNLDDIALFLAVSDAGGLAGAAETTGASPPTLSRRLAGLERTLGKTLFVRGKRGYALTACGRTLLAEAEPLRDVARRLAHFGDRTARSRVRITAGQWTSYFLARNIARVWTPEAEWVPEFLASNATLDIARRAADIGVRGARPEQSWLAGRRTQTRIGYAEYASGPDVTGYLTLSEDTPTTAAERWIEARHAGEIVTRASSGRLLLDLARAGLGRIVVPIFAGEMMAGLTRVSAPIEGMEHEEWLVAHHEARHDPPVRAALDALAALMTDTGLRLPPLH